MNIGYRIFFPKNLAKKIVSGYNYIIRKFINITRFEKVRHFLRELSPFQCASISYFPIVGWIYSLSVKKNHSLCTFHAKQGFVLSLLFILSVIFFNIINIFTPAGWRNFRLVLVVFIYFIIFTYFLFSLFVLIRVARGKSVYINVEIVQRLIGLISI